MPMLSYASLPTELTNGCRIAGLLVVVALWFLAAPTARAAGCQEYDFRDGDFVYIIFGGSNFISGSISSYLDASCQTPAPWTYDEPYGVVYASSDSQAASICRANNSAAIGAVFQPDNWLDIFQCLSLGDDESTETQEILIISIQAHDLEEATWRCRLHTTEATYPIHKSGFSWYCAIRLPGRSRSGGVGGSYFRDIPNLPLIGLKLRAFDGADTGIQFRRLSQYYVGIQSVLDMGVLDVVDVWSNIGSGYEVCFPVPGRVVLLDAATSPREVVPLETYAMDSHTCASSDRAGTMVLVETEAGRKRAALDDHHHTPAGHE